jgi:hypothetical protein
MDSKNELYARYYSALGYLGDSLGMNNKEKKHLKDAVHEAIKNKKKIISITELSYEDMHHLVNSLYDMFPIEFNDKEKKEMNDHDQKLIFEILSDNYNLNSRTDRVKVISDLTGVHLNSVLFDKDKLHEAIDNWIDTQP